MKLKQYLSFITILLLTTSIELIAIKPVKIQKAAMSVCAGNGITFDGVNDFVAIPEAVDNAIATSDFTVELWVNPVNNTQSDPAIISNKNWGGGTNIGWVLAQEGTKFRFNIGNGARYDVTFTAPTATVWSHVAVVVSRLSGITIYVNGVSQGLTVTNGSTVSAITGTLATTNGLKLAQDGTGAYSKFWAGKMDEVRIWKIARTSEDINANMNFELANPSGESNLIAYYQFNECAATSTLTAIKGGYAGTLTNMDAATCWSASTFPKSNAPVAAFTATTTSIAEGTTINFTDKSGGAPTSWSWTFAGGTLATSTAQHPVVTYATAGIYAVSLNATNANGTGATLTKTGYITVTTATSDKILTLNTTNGYVNLPAAADNLATGDFTVELWCKPTTLAYDPAFITDKNWASGANLGWGLFQDNGRFWFNISNGTTRVDIRNLGSITPGNWYHVAVVVQRAGFASVYINGTLAGRADISAVSGNVATGTGINLGQDITGIYNAKVPNASFNEVRIWNMARTPAQISANMCAGSITPASEANLVAYYKLDETWGTTVYDSKGTAHGALINLSTPSCWGAFGTCPTAAAPSASAVVATTATATTASSFTANWLVGIGASNYLLDVSTNSGFTSFVAGYNNILTGNVLTKSITGLSANTLYYYRLRSSDGLSSAYSNTITAYTYAPPTANASSSITANTFNASWATVSGATGYYIDVATDNAFSSILASYTNLSAGNVLTKSITGLTPNTNYYFRVRAVDAIGTSANSNTITTKTSTTAPTSSAATTLTATSFSANWISKTGATEYFIDVATDNSFTSILSSYNNVSVGNVTTSSITGLSGNTTYYYRVRASNGSQSVSSTFQSALTLPASPTSSAASSITSTGFTANWTPPTQGAATFSYTVEYGAVSDLSSGTTTVPTIVSSNLSQAISSLTANTTYYYRVKAVNATGVGSWSAIQSVLTSPATPTATAANNLAATSISANWSVVTGATGYYIDVATDNAFTSMVSGFNNQSVGNVTYSISGLSGNTTYYYRVRATNGTPSANSNVITALTVPANPTVSAASEVTGTTLTANWVAGSGNGTLSYYLDVATDNAFTSILSGYNNTEVTFVNSKSVIGLTPNTTYYYRVRASNTNGTSGNTGYTTVATTGTIVVLTNTSVATLPDCPTCNVSVGAGTELTVGTNRTYNTITVAPTGKLTVSDQSTLTAAVTLQSDATGNATILDNNAAPLALTGTVEQYLPQGRNWYVSSPLTVGTGNTSVLVGAGKADSVSYYNEVLSRWERNNLGTLTPGVGYVAASSTGTATNTVQFTGTLNSGNVTVDLTNKGGVKAGFNLIANPYPSYLNVMDAINANAHVMSTIWYRTRSTGQTPVFYFETVNTLSGIGTNDAGTGTVTGWVPPMQAFWVRTDADAQTITFTNANRQHAGSVATDLGDVLTTPLKVSKSSKSGSSTLLRLQVSNGLSNNEAVIYTNSNALNGLDAYDSPKMWNGASVAELYTIVGAESLVLNGMNALPLNTEIPLGLKTQASNALSLKATELSHLPSDIKVILKDKLNPIAEFDLTNGAVYGFASDAVTTSDRLSVIFKTTSASTGMQGAFESVQAIAYANAQAQIVVSVNTPSAKVATIVVYNSGGQKIAEQRINTAQKMITQSFIPGVYMVTVQANGIRVNKKVVVK